MRQRSLAEQPSHPSTSLHPLLQAGLNSLDVDLEDELARYRRLQGPKRQPQYSGPPVPIKGQNHFAVAAPATGAAASVTERPAPPLPPRYQPLPLAGDLAVGLPAQPAIAPQTLPLAEAEMPNGYLASSEELLRSLTEDDGGPEDNGALPGDPQPRLWETLLTPLGIGSMLLLLLSSLSLGYLILNPQSMQLLGLERWFNPTAPSGSGAMAPAPQGDIAQPSKVTSPMAAPSPDLAAEEFPELNLDTLSALPPGGSSAPAASAPSISPASQSQSPVPTVQTSPISIPNVAVSPIVRPTTQPRAAAARAASPAAPRVQASPRVTTAPVLSPAPVVPPAAAPAPVAPRRPAAAPVAAAPPEPLYYVVIPYSGDRSLEQVRQVVGDAYVRNFPNGAQVQAGAFSDAGRARSLVRELSQQGISAELMQP